MFGVNKMLVMEMTQECLLGTYVLEQACCEVQDHNNCRLYSTCTLVMCFIHVIHESTVIPAFH